MIQAAPREQYTRLTFLFGNAGPKFRKKLKIFRRGLIFCGCCWGEILWLVIGNWIGVLSVVVGFGLAFAAANALQFWRYL